MIGTLHKFVSDFFYPGFFGTEQLKMQRPEQINGWQV